MTNMFFCEKFAIHMMYGNYSLIIIAQLGNSRSKNRCRCIRGNKGITRGATQSIKNTFQITLHCESNRLKFRVLK